MGTQESSQTKEFTNALIHCTVHQKPHCMVDLSVTAFKDLIQKARSQAIKSIGKAVTIPGFRRGKAPENLVLDAYSAEIEKSTKDALARQAYSECQALASIPNLAPKEEFSYQVQSFSPEEAKLTLSFETAPAVPEVDASRFTIKSVARPEVNADKVNETLRQALFFYADWKTVEGRPVQEGDFIILDADVVDNEAAPSPLFRGTRFEVTDKSMAKWMKDAVMGKNTNDVTEGTSVADEDASEEEKALFKPSKVRLTIKAIEGAKLPELTEELLKKMGADSEEDLKQKIEKQLNEQADEHVSDRLKDQAVEFLIKEYSFELPKSLVRKELEFRSNQLAQDKAFMSHWSSLSEAEKQKMIGFLTSQTEKSIILSLLCSHILKQAKLPFPELGAGSFGEYSQNMINKATNYLIEQASQKAAS